MGVRRIMGSAPLRVSPEADDSMLTVARRIIAIIPRFHPQETPDASR
jgi:hypothetical protein